MKWGGKMNRKKGYSQLEEEFLEISIKVAEEFRYNNAELSRMISPILGRTVRALEQKIGFMKQQKRQEENEETVVVFNEEETKKDELLESTSQSIQIIQNDSLMEDSVPFNEKDVGKIVEVEVVSIQDFGAFCRSDEGKIGLLLKGLITTEFVTDIRDYLQIGDRFKVLVIKDRKEKEKTLLNAKAIGNIIAIKNRMKY